MSFDYSAGRFWFGVGQVLVAAAVGIYTWHSNKEKAQAEDVADIKTRVADLSARVAKLESSIVSHRHLGEVYERINEVGEGLSRLEGKVGGMQATLNITHEYLMGK